jgi:hypothetical protein
LGDPLASACETIGELTRVIAPREPAATTCDIGRVSIERIIFAVYRRKSCVRQVEWHFWAIAA